MRPLPETRSRRLSDSNQVQKVASKKRLTNGLLPNHVTTRAQAKVGVGKNLGPSSLRRKLSPPKVSSLRSRSRNVSPKRTSNNCVNRKSVSSSRVNGHVRHRAVSNGNSGARGEAKESRPKNAGALSSNSNGLMEGKNSRGQLLRTFTHHRYQHNEFDSHNGPKTERERVALHRAMAAEKRADRLKKRRSALWVLNCEAESFLFGETAAEKHEVELPPLTTPPKKRRRMRTNELGSLLKESPILESKLRSPPPATSNSNRNNSQQPIVAVEKVTCVRNSEIIRSEPVEQVNSAKAKEPFTKEIAFTHDIFPSNIVDDELMSIASPQSIYSNASMDTSVNISSDSTSNSQSVRIQSILSSMDWKFSFEELPSDEVWYSTFKRQETPPNFFNFVSYAKNQNPFTPVLLPYETKLLHNRSPAKRKFSRLPRKSPRCHASTLAILSSLKRGRHRNSISSPQSNIGTLSSCLPLSPPPCLTIPSMPSPPLLTSSASSGQRGLGTEISPTKSKRPYRKRHPTFSPPCSPRPDSVSVNSCLGLKSSTLPLVSPPMLSLHPSSPSSSQASPSSSSSSYSPYRSRDLSATQYLWDSIQLLSDPYVIQVLAGERSRSPLPLKFNHIISSHMKTCKESYSSNCVNVKNGTINISPQGKDLNVNSSSSTVVLNSKVSSSSSSSSSKRFSKCCSKDNNHVIGSKFHPISYNLSRNSNSSKYDAVSAFPTESSAPNFRNFASLNNNNKEGAHTNKSKSIVVSSSGCNSKGIYVNCRSRKNSRSSPVVLVADIFKKGNSKLATTGGVTTLSVNSVVSPSEQQQHLQQMSYANNNNNNNNIGSGSGGCKIGTNRREELLFLMEGIPPLPAWPV